MKLPRYVRPKKAKGRTYYYFDAGRRMDGGRELIKLPDIKDPGFGGALARANATRTNRQKKQGTLTFDGLIRLFEKSPEFHALAENTKRSYTRYLGRANALLRDRRGDSPPAAKIERQDILDMRSDLSETTGAANQVIRSVGALYAWAMENGKAKENPTRAVKRFKAKPHEPWPEELVEEALTDPQIGLAVALFYFTGQRINEVVRMGWKAIEGGHMRVYVQKTKSDIRVAMLPELVEMLKGQPKGSVAILTNANGRPWSTGGLRDKLQAWAAERGHHVVPHGLRKNAVISLLEAGCTMDEVSGITDQSYEMIRHYAEKVNKTRLSDAAVIKFDAARKARNKG